MTTIADRVKDCIARSKLSLQEVSIIIGHPPTTVRAWLKGTRVPRDYNLVHIDRMLSALEDIVEEAQANGLPALKPEVRFKSNYDWLYKIQTDVVRRASKKGRTDVGTAETISESNTADSGVVLLR